MRNGRNGDAIVIDLPLAFHTHNTIRHMHFGAYASYRKRLAQEISAATAFRRPERPLAYASVHIVRHSSRIPDMDGLYGGAKPLIDCLCPFSTTHPNGLGFIVDDNPFTIHQTAAPFLIRRGETPRTVITITPEDPEDPDVLARMATMNVTPEDVHRMRGRQTSRDNDPAILLAAAARRRKPASATSWRGMCVPPAARRPPG